MPWVALNGTYHGDYWLLKTDTFSYSLQKAATVFAGDVPATVLSSSSHSSRQIELATEEIVRLAGPAVLQLQTSEGAGSGFLITETGIAVTNAHVARGESDITATTKAGQVFQCKVIYVDPTLDVALIQLRGTGFPHLVFADPSSLRVGTSVLAIGSPSKGFPNSVTKGIVSAVGAMPSEPRTWIQTDAAINPGNSGGPLLNTSGAVVGITTQKEFMSSDGRPLQGIGFALSNDDVLAVLHRLSPNAVVEVQATADTQDGAPGRLNITSDVETSRHLSGRKVRRQRTFSPTRSGWQPSNSVDDR